MRYLSAYSTANLAAASSSSLFFSAYSSRYYFYFKALASESATRWASLLASSLALMSASALAALS